MSFCGLVTDPKHRKMQHTYTHEKAAKDVHFFDPFRSFSRCQGRAVIHLGLDMKKKMSHAQEDIAMALITFSLERE